MFNRKQYKNFARQQLKKRWAVPVVMTLIITVLSTIFQIPDIYRMLSNDAFWALANYEGTSYIEMLQMYNSIGSNSSIISTIIQIAVNSILSVAAITLYLKMSRSPEPVSLKSFIEGLNNWARAILGALWSALWTFLWSLLFFIPGIIKAISYSQMFYLIAEYKDLSVTKAMRISMIITKGYKWDLFILDLSFLGWILLSVLTFGIGSLWLEPYYKMTAINAYHALLKNALETGRIKQEDLTE